MTLPHADLPPLVLRLALPADPLATEALGERVGARLRKGNTLALVGEIGAGKTTFARGLGRGLQLDDPDAVASPTYLLVVEHPGRVPLLHADAYLPQKLAGFLEDGGLEYLFQPGAVACVEWADRLPGLVPANALWIELAMASDGGRICTFRCGNVRGFPWIASLGENPADR